MKKFIKALSVTLCILTILLTLCSCSKNKQMVTPVAIESYDCSYLFELTFKKQKLKAKDYYLFNFEVKIYNPFDEDVSNIYDDIIEDENGALLNPDTYEEDEIRYGHDFVTDKNDGSILTIDEGDYLYSFYVAPHKTETLNIPIAVKKTGQTKDEAIDQILNSKMYFQYKRGDLYRVVNKEEVDFTKLKEKMSK